MPVFVALRLAVDLGTSAGPVDDPGRPSGPWLSTALTTELWGDRRDISTHVEVVYGKRMGDGDSGTVYWGTYKEVRICFHLDRANLNVGHADQHIPGVSPREGSQGN